MNAKARLLVVGLYIFALVQGWTCNARELTRNSKKEVFEQASFYNNDKSNHLLLQTYTNRYLLQHLTIIQSPQDNSYISTDDFSIEFNNTASVDIVTICLVRRGETVIKDWYKCMSPQNFNGILTEDGFYTFEAKVLGGSSRDSVSVSWNLDRSPPETKLVGSLPDGNPIATFSFIGSDEGSFIDKMECMVDDKEWEICNLKITYKGLSLGWHKFSVRSVDVAGNLDPSPAEHIWQVIYATSPGELEFVADDTESDIRNLHQNDMSEMQEKRRHKGFLEDTSAEMEKGIRYAKTNITIVIFTVLAVVLLCLGSCYSIKKLLRAWHTQNTCRRLGDLENELASGRHASILAIGHSEASSLLSSTFPKRLRKFRYEELEAASNGFSNEWLLGEGGFGRVYKGVLEDGTPVAIKRLDKGGQQGDREFFVEVMTLCRARHSNIICLIGACVHDGHRACVFELMQKGSVADLLDSRDPEFVWERRLEIAMGAARGLACLHESVSPPIVHRDFKTANLLLNENGEVRISDFGLSTLSTFELKQDNSYENSALLGTYSYLAPECTNSGSTSTKSDVYAFGVVMVELLTGRSPFDYKRPIGERELIKWIMRKVDKLEEIIGAVDPIIANQVSNVQIAAYVELAVSCLNSNPTRRPAASQVAESLVQLAAFKDPALDTSQKKPSLTVSIAGKLSVNSGLIPSCEAVNAQSFSEAGTPYGKTPKDPGVLEIREIPKRLERGFSSRSSIISGCSDTPLCMDSDSHSFKRIKSINRDCDNWAYFKTPGGECSSAVSQQNS